MSALDKIKQEQQDSETLASLTLRLDAVEAHERELTKSVNAMSGFLKVMDEALTAAINQVKELISQQHEQPSQTQLDDETKNSRIVSAILFVTVLLALSLSEIEKTLAEVAKQLSLSGAVKLNDGSTVTQSDLQALSMMKQINQKMTTLDSTSKELAQEVHDKSHVKLDGEVTGKWLAKKVVEHFDKAVQEPVDGLRSDLQGFREEMGALGAERLSEVRREVDETVSTLNKKVDVMSLKLTQVCQKFEDIERRATFVGASRIVLAVLPLFAALILVGGLVWGFGSMVGIGPLFGWIWTSFTAASLWWHKLLIAIGGLGAAAFFVWVVFRMSRWVYENLR